MILVALHLLFVDDVDASGVIHLILCEGGKRVT